MKRSVLAFVIPASLFAFTACDLPPLPVGGDTDSDTEPGSSGDPISTTTPTTTDVATGPGMVEMTTTETSGSEDTESGSDAEGGSTTSEDDPGPCNPLASDCMGSDGCYPADDALACAGPAGDAQVGDECGEHTDCAPGRFCGDDSVCHLFCDTTEPGSCEDPSLVCEAWFEADAPAGLEELGGCVEGPEPSDCDPIVQGCPPGEACYPGAGDNFTCQAGDGPAQVGDECDSHASCAEGLWCSVDVCVLFCDIDVTMKCAGGLACSPWFDGGAPIGLEHVGACFPEVVEPEICDIIGQDCAPGNGCFPTEKGAQCLPEGPAQAGDVCDSGCTAGTTCIEPNTCFEICDPTAPTCLDPAAVCVDAYPPGAAPAGLENYGYCQL